MDSRSTIVALQKELEEYHAQVLAAAVAEHDYIRRNAQREKERVQLAIQTERRRLEDEEIRALERDKQLQIEQEIALQRRELEEKRKTEEHRKAAEEAKAQAEAEEARRQEQEREDAQRAVREQEAKEKEREQKAAAARKQAQDASAAKASPASQSSVPAKTDSTSNVHSTGSHQAAREAEHQRYLDIHKKLKEFRAYMVQERRKNPTLKQRMSEGRQMIKKSVGQLTQGTVGANLTPLKNLRGLFTSALKMPEPATDVRPFLTPGHSTTIPDANARIPALFLYLINIFSKSVMTQFINEAGVRPESAEPTGIVAISIFAAPEFRWQGVSLMDILLAKYHVVCPVLWGIYGDESTERGRQRVGWWREEPGGAWVSEQRHGERMTGLGAGFASLSLRDFQKSKNSNPFPHRHYWKALACITNTPPADRTQTHFLVLKAMTELYVQRFIGFYGQAGIAALRRALVDFPRETPQQTVASRALSTVPELLKKSQHLLL